jgi:UDP-glucose 4-epimerase
VTGGAGFIGSNLVENLLDSGEEVVVLDNMHTGSLNNLESLKGNLKVIQASCNDILNQNLNPKAIYHLGIPSSSPMYRGDPFLVGTAINGTIAVFELAKKMSCKVVYASSSSLYSGIEPPHRENMAIPVSDYYTEARLTIERIAELYKRLFDIDSVGMRFFSVYGPREKAKRQYANMVSQFLWGMMEGRAPVIYGDGSQTRDFIYVDDVVKALNLAMTAGYQGILNVGTGKAHSFNEVIAILKRKLDSDVEQRYVNNPIKNYVIKTLADTSMAKKEIGFEAQVSLEKGIDKLCSIYEMDAA